MYTIAIKYEDNNVIDFAVTRTQQYEFGVMLAELNQQTNEDWSSCFSEVEVDILDDGSILYAHQIYVPNGKGGCNYGFSN